MTSLEEKYGFPLFTKKSTSVYLGDHKKLVIADIWPFWDYVIKKNKSSKDFMKSLLEQAQNFYISAEQSPIRSKPLLYYYSFLNLAKVIINLENSYSQSAIYMHGIKEENKGKFSKSEITVLKKKHHIKNVACEFMEVIDHKSITQDIIINVKDLLAHCVGIHRSYSEIYNEKEIFFRLYSPSLFKDGKKMFYLAELKCTDSEKRDLLQIGYDIYEDDGKNIYRCEITTSSYNKTRADYHSLSSKLRNEGVWYFVGNDGYVMYLSSLHSNRYSPESIIYNTMFYLGSITRYHPYLFDKIFSDKEQWLMSEFLTTQPKQFLFLSTAKALGQYVLKAYSSF